jgi:Crp-like helix-turn-helix domain
LKDLPFQTMGCWAGHHRDEQHGLGQSHHMMRHLGLYLQHHPCLKPDTVASRRKCDPATQHLHENLAGCGMFFQVLPGLESEQYQACCPDIRDQEASAREGQYVYSMTQQEMAALAGTARELVGRALKELEAAGAIEMRQGRAMVVNPERLRMLSSG